MPHTLLLADDSVTIQRVIELTFADEDVQVVAVSDGDQAIERLNANPPDIVLADIGMPGKSGYEVARYIRLSPRLQHIPVVLLTGAFEPVDQERAAEAGCDGVLAKPFEPQLVIARVRELLARSSKSPGQARAAVARPEASAALPQPAPAAPPASAPPAAAGSSADKTADYFDQLDAAFATLSNASATQSAPLSAPPPNAPSRSAEEIDWFASQLSAPAPATEMWDLPGPAAASELADLPLSTIEVPSVVAELDVTLPETGAEVPGAEVLGAARGAQVPSAPAPPQHVTSAHPAPEHVAPRHPAPHPAPPHPAPQHPVVLPSVADAFAALLAAEQGEPPPTVAPTWPTSSAPAPAVTEELVERVTRQVLDRLSDKVVRDAVADVTSSIAERLVLEEIERIKSSIK